MSFLVRSTNQYVYLSISSAIIDVSVTFQHEITVSCYHDILNVVMLV